MKTPIPILVFSYLLIPTLLLGQSNKVHRIPKDFQTFQSAINASIQGDTILVSNGIYSGYGNRTISLNGKNLVILSENGPLKTLIKLNNHQGFLFYDGEDSTSVLDGFTIYGGDSGAEGDSSVKRLTTNGGAISIRHSSPTIKNCIIERNTGYYGSGIHVVISSSRFMNCVVRNNKNFWGAGGGVSLIDDFTVWENCLITGNETGWGAGVFMSHSGSTFINCSIVFNNALAEKSARNITAWYKGNTPVFKRSILYGGGSYQIGFAPFDEESTLNPTFIESIVEGYTGNFDIIPDFKNLTSFELSETVYDKLNIDFKIGDSIDYLPNNVIENEPDYLWIYLIISHLLFGALASFVVIYFKRNKNSQNHSEEMRTKKLSSQTKTNQIYLFGALSITNADGFNCAQNLTNKVKELLLRILLTETSNSVATETILASLWPEDDSSRQKTFNSTLSKLKKSLTTCGLSIEIIKSEYQYLLKIDPSIAVDYVEFRQLNEKLKSGAENDVLNSWIDILNRGNFLAGISYDWLDSVRAEIEREISSIIDIHLSQCTDDQRKKLIQIKTRIEE